MKKIILSCLFIPFLGLAQQKTNTVLLLKNGSQIKCNVVEVNASTVKVETADKSIFVFQMTEVEKITKDEQSQTDNYTTSTSNTSIATSTLDYVPKKKGYTFIGEIGGVFILGENGGAGVDVNLVNGLKLNKMSLGAGVGINNFDGFLLLPITMDYRVDFLEGKYTPFINIGAGYAVDLQDYSDFGGPTGNVNFGAKIGLDKSVALHLSLGYRLLNSPNWGVTTNMFSLRAGVSF